MSATTPVDALIATADRRSAMFSPCAMLGILSVGPEGWPSRRRFTLLREAHLLLVRRIKILRREPAFKREPACRPLAIKHGEPGAIAASALDDHVLPEHALEGEAKPQRCAARGGVERVAPPLVTPIVKRLEHVTRK